MLHECGKFLNTSSELGSGGFRDSALSCERMNVLNLLLRLAFGGFFVYAAATKLFGPLGLVSFTDDIRTFHILPDPWVGWLAMTLPWFEIFCGIAVIIGPLRQGALVLLNLCLVVFLVALISAWVRGLDVSCGCFGHADAHTSVLEMILRDLGLLLVGCWLLASSRIRREKL